MHYIPQAPYTYAVAGLMNEKQVSIVETTWGGRKELRNPEGWLGYFDLMNLALQRAASAREAIAVMHKLVQEYVPKQGRNLRHFSLCLTMRNKVVREAKEKAPIIAELDCGEITCTKLVLYEIIHIFAELKELNYGRCKQ